NRLEQTPKLTIAALNGHCVGGGLEIAMACDLRIAKKDGGKLGLPEVHLGVLPGTGGTQRLVRILGKAKALLWMATGQRVSFAAGLEAGIIQKILDDGDFWGQATAYAREFCPPNRAAKAVGFIKRSVQSGAEVGFHEGLALERELQQQLFQSQDAQEGIAAFVEKRKPDFQGR
ncbi:MAG: enoyl-CoA hydratase-related protein, partial [Planctomycetota bacterium]